MYKCEGSWSCRWYMIWLFMLGFPLVRHCRYHYSALVVYKAHVLYERASIPGGLGYHARPPPTGEGAWPIYIMGSPPFPWGFEFYGCLVRPRSDGGAQFNRACSLANGIIFTKVGKRMCWTSLEV